MYDINRISLSKVKSLSSKLKQLRKNHIFGMTAFNKQIICNKYDNSFIENHTECDFGRWYNTLQTEVASLGEEFINEDFISLGNLHKKLHGIANFLLEKHKNNNSIQEDEYELLIEIQGKISDIFDNLYSAINSVRYSIDALTGLPNPELFNSILKKEYAKPERMKTDNCLAFVDIDYFKKVNDTYGHLVGDEVLKALPQKLSSSLRKDDLIGRYGGDEFLIFLPNTNLAEAKNILERIRHKIRNSAIEIKQTAIITVTCSFGLSSFTLDKPLSENIKNADNALYLAKESGRNKVYVHSMSLKV
ncbi:MAG: sensor domain-containing diguanylate cyclase [Victivallales bacterium]|nr:sensor domain-containing diguanylate cyclase [Victivallales bacterium]